MRAKLCFNKDFWTQTTHSRTNLNFLCWQHILWLPRIHSNFSIFVTVLLNWQQPFQMPVPMLVNYCSNESRETTAIGGAEVTLSRCKTKVLIMNESCNAFKWLPVTAGTPEVLMPTDSANVFVCRWRCCCSEEERHSFDDYKQWFQQKMPWNKPQVQLTSTLKPVSYSLSRDTGYITTSNPLSMEAYAKHNVSFSAKTLFTFTFSIKFDVFASRHVDTKYRLSRSADSVPSARSRRRAAPCFRLAGFRFLLCLVFSHIKLLIDYFWNGLNLCCKLLFNLMKWEPEESIKIIRFALLNRRQLQRKFSCQFKELQEFFKC